MYFDPSAFNSSSDFMVHPEQKDKPQRTQRAQRKNTKKNCGPPCFSPLCSLCPLWSVHSIHHFSPNCSPPLFLFVPPFSGPSRLGIAGARCGSSTGSPSFFSADSFFTGAA